MSIPVNIAFELVPEFLPSSLHVVYREPEVKMVYQDVLEIRVLRASKVTPGIGGCPVMPRKARRVLPVPLARLARKEETAGPAGQDCLA